MLIKNVFGIDLGTSTVKIYSLRKDEITKEQNMIAVKDSYDVLAVGNDAYEMYEKAPDSIDVRSPMSYGMIADVDCTEIVLHTLLKRADRHMGKRPILYFSVPTDMTEIERRAYYSTAKGGQLKNTKVYMVDRPIADAVALGIHVAHTKGTMIVNIGAQSSEASIVADGRTIISKVIHIGGSKLDYAIADAVRRKKNLLIGLRTAQRLKLSLATLGERKKEARKIVGVNTLSGLPREGIVSSLLVSEAVIPTIHEIGEGIKSFIERTPPQIAQIILKDGIYLTGGCTRIPNFANYLSSYIGYPVKVSEYFELSTIHGLQQIIQDKSLHEWVISPKNRKKF